MGDVSSAGPGAVLVVGVVLVVAVLVVGVWYSTVRRKRLVEWAARNGWSYTSSDPSLENLSSRYPFDEGHGRRTGEVLRGRFAGTDALSFVYSWKTGSGKDEHSHTAHVAALALPAWLPVVEVTPQGVLDRVATALGAQDLRFESEEFNRAFRIQASDERTAYGVVHPRLMERLLQPDGRRTAWRIDGAWILSWQNGATDLDTLATRLGLLSAVVAAVPRHVWQDHGYDPLAGPAR
jgi:hypothetical protein